MEKRKKHNHLLRLLHLFAAIASISQSGIGTLRPRGLDSSGGFRETSSHGEGSIPSPRSPHPAAVHATHAAQ